MVGANGGRKIEKKKRKGKKKIEGSLVILDDVNNKTKLNLTK